MKRFNSERGRSVMVAVNFNRDPRHLVETAINLCKRTGLGLHLTHIVEPWVGLIETGLMPYPDLSSSIDAEALEKAKRDLAELAESLPGQVGVTFNARLGRVVDALIEESQAVQAALVLIGTSPSLTKFVPKGLSSALSMLGNSRVPVLALPYSKSIDFAAADLGILVCDNLAEEGASAFDWAVDLAYATEGTLHHLHVNSLDASYIESALTMAAASTYRQINPPLTTENFLTSLTSLIEGRMQERGRRHRSKQEFTELKYEPYIVTGDVQEAMANFIDERKESIDLIVFGQHQTLHRKPFLIGQVPFRRMLAQDHPILVVPARR